MSRKIKIKETREQLNKIRHEIKSLLDTVSYEEDNSCQRIEIENTPDGRMIEKELEKILYKLQSSVDTIECFEWLMTSKVIQEGILHKNTSGCYKCEFKEFRSGDEIEILLHDNFNDYDYWAFTRVEFNDDYYVVENPQFCLEGARVRLRKS